MSSSKASITINGERIAPGTSRSVKARIARLPSGTDIELPIYVFRHNKPGPTVLLSGGLHGDEINGIEIVRRLQDEGIFESIECGSIVAIPVVNIFGFLNFSREVPDGKDVNRSFPGNAGGSLAARIAHFLTKEVLPAIDIGVDFHTGGASRFNFPQVRYAGNDARAETLAKVFGAPVILQSSLIDRSLRKQAYKMKKSIIVFEGGESMRLDEEVIREGMDGAQRILKHLGMLSSAPERALKPVECTKSSWIRAKRSGIYKGTLVSGMHVNKRDVLGHITDPFGEFKVKVKAASQGFILGHNNMPIVNQGDALIHLGHF